MAYDTDNWPADVRQFNEWMAAGMPQHPIFTDERATSPYLNKPALSLFERGIVDEIFHIQKTIPMGASAYVALSELRKRIEKKETA